MNTKPSPQKICAVSDHFDETIRLARQRLEQSPEYGQHAMGIEIEFFLKDQNNKLSDLEFSQNFLKELSTQKKWGVFTTNPQSNCIVSVSQELDRNRYHSVKYEHPPHLLEIALAYENNLISLRDSLSETIQTLKNTAKSAGAILEFTSTLNPTPLNWNAINKIDNKFEKLYQSRGKLLTSLHPNANHEHTNFSAFLAATQYHISGYCWWKEDPEFMERLYHSEALISLLAFNNKNEFNARWEKYRSVFSHMKLLGFPQIQSWTFEQWLKQMTTDNPLEKDIFQMRDFELIKPKWIGTLEYRADPSSSDVQKIIQQAALRFASYLNAQKRDHKGPLHSLSFGELASAWHSGELFHAPASALTLLKEQAWQALRERGLGEEGLL